MGIIPKRGLIRGIVSGLILESGAIIAIVAAMTLAGCSRNPNAFDVVGGTALDGDTFIANPTHEHVRLLRIDAPELPGHPCPIGRRPSCIDDDPAWAGRSWQYLQDILDSHRLTCVRDKKDVYGRTLAECYFYANGDENVSSTMLAAGMAVPYRR